MKQGDKLSLPKGWEIKKLGEVLLKTEMVDPTKKPDNSFTYLDVSSVNKETKEIEGATVLLGKDAPSRARKLVKKNDVIFATVRPTHSRVALITEEYNGQVCSTGYFVLRGKENIYNKYLFYFLLTDEFNEQMEKLQKGASYPAVTDAKVKSIFLRFPKDLPEQQRIVSILDEAFAAISKAKANAEQNLKNAKELFESYLQGVFEKKGDGWEVKKLGEVTNIQRGSSPRPKGDPRYFSARETKFNWITISDISSFCEDNVLLRTREWLTEEGSKQSRFVDENEFIIAVSGSTTGKCCITGIKGFIYDGLAVVKVKKNILDPIFLLNYMMSLYSTINNSKAGAAFPNINTNYLNNLPI